MAVLRRLLLVLGFSLALGAQSLTTTALAAAGGFAAGALIGARAISYSSLPQNLVASRRLRVSLTYGTMGGVISGALSLRNSSEQQPHRFLLDRWNTPLFLGVVGIQALDYASTRYFRDRGKDEWLLTNGVVDKRPAFIATEIGAVATSIGLSYIFHQTNHHRLERAVSFAHIGFGAVSARANYLYPSTGHALFN